MAQTKEKDKGPLWTPEIGLKVKLDLPVSGRREVARVDGFEEWPAPAPKYYGAVKPEGKTVTMVRYFGVYDPVLDGPPALPRWGVRPTYVSLTHWRRAIPTMEVLAPDWEPSFVPRTLKVTATEDQMLALAEAVQALAGEVPNAKFEALLNAARPFVARLGVES